MRYLRTYMVLAAALLVSATTAFAQGNSAQMPLLALNTSGVSGEDGEGNLPPSQPIAEKDTGIVRLEGTYQGKNIYINNPSNAYGNEYAVISAMLNGRPVGGLNKSNFMIDLSGYAVGKYVNVEILYKTKGFPPPQVLNPNAIRSKSTFELISLEATEQNITWKTRGETSEEPFIVERDIGTGLWSDWVLVGTVKGKGSKIYNEYKFPVEHFAGTNKYRIKQRDGMYQYSYLPPIAYASKKDPVTLADTKVTAKLKLSTRTNFEIYDAYGRLILKGSGKTIDVTGIASGTYFIKIENKTDTFVIK